MLTSAIVTFFLIVTVAYGRVLLYNTENEQTVEKFDCVYYMANDGEEISYCRRSDGSQRLDEKRDECDNQGKKKSFHDLLSQEINPNKILDWSSSVEMVDMYASVFYNRSLIDDNDDRFICHCIKSGTFGKYCEYQLTHETKSFSQAIEAQFKQKKNDDPWNTQRYGKILCYETLLCHSSPLCLDWREICDGVQRCSGGIDEENWDKLEFNECEDNEFRCTNGMCIAEEFWLDGDYDCMDWSDEYLQDFGDMCPFEPNAMECDEHLCFTRLYSCGDGQCVQWETRIAFQRFSKAADDCFNKRNLNHMCEVSPHQLAWTLESGLCCPDKGYDDYRYPSWDMIDTANLTNNEKCQYLFRCVLSRGFEHDCPCNHLNCTQMMMRVCSISGNLVVYPPEGLINANVLFFYNYSQPMENPTFQLFALSGTFRCRGYFFQTNVWIIQRISPGFIFNSHFNHRICLPDNSKHGYKNPSSPFQNDKFCWNSSLTFNGRLYAVNPDMCHIAGECISQYRIHDGLSDCAGGNEDEVNVPKKSYCTGNVGRQRFQCFNDQGKCLTLITLGTGTFQCSNFYDENLYGNGGMLQNELPCSKRLNTDCHRLKIYIQQSSVGNSSNNTSSIGPKRQESTSGMNFLFFCDSFSDLTKNIDEMTSSCQHWVCQYDQFQCRTGQCIDIEWVCDGEWDCTDASDEEAIVLIEKWSIHNTRLSNLSSQLEKCRERYSKSPFSTICNTSFEFGCYLPGVLNPLDIKSNRPCINLTQIGDGLENCHNAFDERNTFTANSYEGGMWGFHLRCGNRHVSYAKACYSTYIYNCTDILCSINRDKDGSCSDIKDFICIEGNHCKKNARCNGILDCLYGEDEYWCPNGTFANQVKYRQNKEQLRKQRINKDLRLFSIWYPSEAMVGSNQQQVLKPIINIGSDHFFKVHSYLCNRGVAVLQMNETRCLCPPAYYGRWCEFFSDRMSIIAHVDQKTELKTISNITLKFKTNFLFNNTIIDHHEFSVVPTFEKNKTVKHKFYLLYSRSVQMLAHKKWRYFNRTDVINNHPYCIHFDVFALEKNNTVEELGSWHYPIYFDYLPAFRLAIVLRFPSWFGNVTLGPCWPNSCNENSTCMPVFNQNNSYYCSCKSGYYGRNCSIYEPHCDIYCSPNAFCRPDDHDLQAKKNKLSCICPPGHFGPRCNLKYDGCESNPCLNNGTCLSNYDRSGEEPYICNCSWRYYGKQCENEKTSIRINLNMTMALSVRAAVVQLYDYSIRFGLEIRHQQIYHDLSSVISYYDSNVYAPLLGVLKIYEGIANPQYFIMYHLFKSLINITLSPQHCPHASLLLSEKIDQPVLAAFKYHQICQNDTQRFCFYDENYLCLCQSNHSRVDCFIHDTQLDHCDKCQSGGKCLQDDSNDFLCLCPSCHQGSFCEFSLQPFGFTLESLVIDYSKNVKIVYLVLAFLFFIVGLFNNLCAFVTFKRPTPRKVGVGNYLFIITCFNQAALFFLLYKFILITFEISNIESCKTISYLLSVFTRSIYWLTSWVTIDRFLMILFPTSFVLKNPRLAIGVSVATSIVLLTMQVHEIIYYTIIPHLPTGSFICVTNFNTDLILVYNKTSTLIHHLLPFFIQVISITFLIVLAARSRVKTAGAKITFRQLLIKQFRTQKELYIMPMIIIFSALPQTIITFSLACRELTDWQRHALLSAYLLSYVPQILSFIIYVLPSTSYKKEFGETLLAKRLKSMLDRNSNNNNQIINPKTKN